LWRVMGVGVKKAYERYDPDFEGGFLQSRMFTFPAPLNPARSEFLKLGFPVDALVLSIFLTPRNITAVTAVS